MEISPGDAPFRKEWQTPSDPLALMDLLEKNFVASIGKGKGSRKLVQF